MALIKQLQQVVLVISLPFKLHTYISEIGCYNSCDLSGAKDRHEDVDSVIEDSRKADYIEDEEPENLSDIDDDEVVNFFCWFFNLCLCSTAVSFHL